MCGENEYHRNSLMESFWNESILENNRLLLTLNWKVSSDWEKPASRPDYEVGHASPEIRKLL